MTKIKVLGKIKSYDLKPYYIVEELHTKGKFVTDRKLYLVKDLKNVGTNKVKQSQQIVDVISHMLFLNNKSVFTLFSMDESNKTILERIKPYFREEEDPKLKELVSTLEEEGDPNTFFLHYVNRVKAVKKIAQDKPVFVDPEKDTAVTGIYVYYVEYNSDEVKQKYAPFILLHEYSDGADLTVISNDVMKFFDAYLNEQLHIRQQGGYFISK